MLIRPCQVMGRWKIFLTGKTKLRGPFFLFLSPPASCVYPDNEEDGPAAATPFPLI